MLQSLNLPRVTCNIKSDEITQPAAFISARIASISARNLSGTLLVVRWMMYFPDPVAKTPNWSKVSSGAKAVSKCFFNNGHKSMSFGVSLIKTNVIW